MNISKRIITVFALITLMATLVFSNTIPVLAYPVQSGTGTFGIEQVANNTATRSDIKGATKIEKFVCRYINGQKRCWEE